MEKILGNVTLKQLDENYYVSNNGFVYSLNKQRFLSIHDNGKGYKTVSINRKSRYIHRLVAQTFIPNPLNKSDVNHKDGNKSNNSVENLEWNTRKENQVHASINGLIAQGERVAGSKLNKEQVIDVFNSKGLHKDIAVKFGIGRMAVGKIKRKERWKHILNNL